LANALQPSPAWRFLKVPELHSPPGDRAGGACAPSSRRWWRLRRRARPGGAGSCSTRRRRGGRGPGRPIGTLRLAERALTAASAGLPLSAGINHGAVQLAGRARATRGWRATASPWRPTSPSSPRPRPCSVSRSFREALADAQPGCEAQMLTAGTFTDAVLRTHELFAPDHRVPQPAAPPVSRGQRGGVRSCWSAPASARASRPRPGPLPSPACTPSTAPPPRRGRATWRRWCARRSSDGEEEALRIGRLQDPRRARPRAMGIVYKPRIRTSTAVVGAEDDPPVRRCRRGARTTTSRSSSRPRPPAS